MSGAAAPTEMKVEDMSADDWLNVVKSSQSAEPKPTVNEGSCKAGKFDIGYGVLYLPQHFNKALVEKCRLLNRTIGDAPVVLHVHSIECKGLAAKDDNGLSDPYILIKSEEDVAKHGAKAKALFTSKVHSKTLNTKWDFEAGPDKQTVDIRLPLSNNAHFLIYDKDLLKKDDFMGRVELSPAAILLLQCLSWQANGGKGSPPLKKDSLFKADAKDQLPPVQLQFLLDSHFAARDEHNKTQEVQGTVTMRLSVHSVDVSTLPSDFFGNLYSEAIAKPKAAPRISVTQRSVHDSAPLPPALQAQMAARSDRPRASAVGPSLGTIAEKKAPSKTGSSGPGSPGTAATAAGTSPPSATSTLGRHSSNPESKDQGGDLETVHEFIQGMYAACPNVHLRALLAESDAAGAAAAAAEAKQPPITAATLAAAAAAEGGDSKEGKDGSGKEDPSASLIAGLTAKDTVAQLAADVRRVHAWADLFDPSHKTSFSCECESGALMDAWGGGLDDVKKPAVSAAAAAAAATPESSDAEEKKLHDNGCLVLAFRSFLANEGRNWLIRKWDDMTLVDYGLLKEASVKEVKGKETKTTSGDGKDGKSGGDGDSKSSKLARDVRGERVRLLRGAGKLQSALLRLMWNLSELGKSARLPSSPIHKCSGKLIERTLSASCSRLVVEQVGTTNLVEALFCIEVKFAGRTTIVKKMQAEIDELSASMKQCLRDQSVDSLVSLPSLPAELPQSLLKEYRDAANKAEAEHKQKAPGTPFTPPALKGKLIEAVRMVDEYMRDMTSPGMREWLLPPLGAGGTAPQQSRLVIHKFCGIAPRASTLRMDSPQALSRVMSHALFKKGILALIEENTPRRTLPTEILEVLFEILMGTRSDETSVGEFAFATLMSESFVLPLVISAMSAAPFMVSLTALEHLVRQLVQHPNNAMFFSVDPKVRWQSWFLPLLLPPPPSIVVAVTEHKNSAAAMAAAVTAPASALDSEDGNFCERLTDEQARLKEFNLSLLVMVLVHSQCYLTSRAPATDKRSIYQMLVESIMVIGEGASWDPPQTTALIKALVDAFVTKIRNTVRQWKDVHSHAAWSNMFQTTTALKELLLYTVPAPKQTAASAAAAAASAASQMAGALNQSTAAAVPKAVETISSPKRPSHRGHSKSVLDKASIIAARAASPLAGAAVAPGTQLVLLDSSSMELVIQLFEALRFAKMDQDSAVFGLDPRELEVIRAHKKQGLADQGYFQQAFEVLKLNPTSLEGVVLERSASLGSTSGAASASSSAGSAAASTGSTSAAPAAAGAGSATAGAGAAAGSAPAGAAAASGTGPVPVAGEHRHMLTRAMSKFITGDLDVKQMKENIEKEEREKAKQEKVASVTGTLLSVGLAVGKAAGTGASGSQQQDGPVFHT